MKEEVQERFYDFMKTFLRTERVTDVSRVIAVREDETWSGGCETCSFVEMIVDITYISYHGERRTYTYYGSLADLLGVE